MVKTQSPHKFMISKNDQHIFYYGGSHINQIGHPMFKDIQEFWNNFLKKTISSKYESLVLIEGGIRKLYPTLEECIKNDGEAGFITYIANKSNIKVNSPEPLRKLIDRQLIKKFTREQIQYYYFARIVNQYLSGHIDEDFTDYVSKFLQTDSEESEWKRFEFTIKNMENIHKKIFNKNFNLSDKEFFYKIINPTTKYGVINEIAKKVSQLRDKNIAKNIINKWDKKYNIFVLYSFYHAYQQEPILRHSILK